ncbi:CPBP family intramembrane glutamic endopeptidase [Haloglycomyces albus]|uniref:CPBP family intramembrane glutamic endopeptidase n=1 Tax=Haloglycomyces albus TaxID=526067 RepID=UPI0004A2C038|nr:CPBP family intramembrane glutamic endopeptidase [Haloglycomyces albus]
MKPTLQLAPRTLKREVVIVLALSLGASAVWSVINFGAILTAPGGLTDAVVSMNNSRADETRPWLDLTRQLASILLALAPVGLVLHLLHLDRPHPFQLIGLDGRRPGRDLLLGVGLAALIGLPGIALYLLGRALGFNATVSAAGLNDVWWAVPILLLAATKAALIEEIVGVAYLVERLKQLAFRPVTIVALHAALRGSYHLYQGVGAFVGNAIMGAVFALFYLRFKRVTPLIIAHFTLDVVAFVGYSQLADHVSWL